jgi:hypothetical protein
LQFLVILSNSRRHLLINPAELYVGVKLASFLDILRRPVPEKSGGIEDKRQLRANVNQRCEDGGELTEKGKDHADRIQTDCVKNLKFSEMCGLKSLRKK